MVGFSVEFLKPAVEVFAHVAEYPFEALQMLFPEHRVPVFGDENHMHMHVENTVSAFAYLVVFLHETKYNGSRLEHKKHKTPEEVNA